MVGSDKEGKRLYRELAIIDFIPKFAGDVSRGKMHYEVSFSFGYNVRITPVSESSYKVSFCCKDQIILNGRLVKMRDGESKYSLMGRATRMATKVVVESEYAHFLDNDDI